MTLRVVHRTHYQYDGPVSRCHNEAHLRPRDTQRQRCLENHVTVEPVPSSWSERTDFFGNLVTAFTVEGPFDELVVTSTSEVAVWARDAFPATGPTWDEARRVLATERSPDVLEARPFCLASPLVPHSAALRQYAEPSFATGRPLLGAVTDLADRIFTEFAYDPGFTTVSTPLADVVLSRRGVCQDFAHLAVGCLRSMGLAARYVSGYLETEPPPGEERRIGGDASHAWAAVFVPGWGWLDIDPTNDRLVGSSYVTTAWGRDYSDVTPLKGVMIGGGATHTFEVSVDVSRASSASHP